jgi:anaerobic dimethyl sulfoxide reductase subunit A
VKEEVGFGSNIKQTDRNKRKLSEKKDESITQKKLSRRSLLKWAGALTAAVVVGGGVEYAATYKAPPPPPPSLKPPLSPEIQTRVDSIVKDLVDRHAGEEIKYSACSMNCGGTGCTFAYHIKNGVITCVEPDQTHHPNVGMEDKVMTQQEFDWGLINKRGCPVGWVWREYLNDPVRLTYPIMRAPGSARGEGKWVRKSWDDATSMIANNMKQMKEKYGPFFLLMPYGARTQGFEQVSAIWGAGCMGYGCCSDDVSRLTGPFSGLGGNTFTTAPGNDIQDALKYSKLQIIEGITHYTTHFGGSGYAAGWYRRLAREKGTPIIIIDPKYSWDVENIADQWIPIKPGTDNALQMAMAYVILTEGLYDQSFIDKWMRPKDFQPQADYILGKGGKGVNDYAKIVVDLPAPHHPDGGYAEYDKIPKTPEWAEKICGVPAETIRELARLYAKTKPAIFEQHLSVRRKQYGEYMSKMLMWICIITGNGPLVHGGYCDSRNAVRTASISYGSMPRGQVVSEVGGGTGIAYAAPTFFRAFNWWKAPAYALKVQRGEPSILYPGKKMTWEEWATIVGYNSAPEFVPMFNPKMFWGTACDYTVVGENVNAQHKIMTDPSIEFIFHWHNRIIDAGKYSDLILPLTDASTEETLFSGAGYGGLDSQNFVNRVVQPPAEAKQWDEVCCMLLEKLGKDAAEGRALALRYWSEWKGTQTFLSDMEASNAARWEKTGRAWLKNHGVDNPPTWQELRSGANVGHWHPAQFAPDIDTYCGFTPTPDKTPWVPLDTLSGKYEHYWDACTGFYERGKPVTVNTRGKEHFDYKGRKYAQMPNDWRDLQPISVYHPTLNGMEASVEDQGKQKNYPLMITTPNSRYVVHYVMADPGNPRTRDCRRHSLHISPTDAKARGIKDNDLVRVWNDNGQVALPAYVTNRNTPGVVHIRMGMPPSYSYQNIGGLDICRNEDLTGASVNIFTGGDDFSPVTPAHVTNVVQVEKYLDRKEI